MFRNAARVLKLTRSLWIVPRVVASCPGRNPTFGASWTATQISKIDLRCGATLTRKYSSTAGETQGTGPSSERKESLQDFPWLEMLESAAQAPWLTSTPLDPHDRLRRAYSLLFHVILYLGRPMPKDLETAAQQFLFAFNSVPVSPETEIGRARYAVGLLVKVVASDISTVPQSSPIRAQYAQIFALAEALMSLCHVHLQALAQGTPPTTGEVVENGKWQDFWEKAQPVVLALGEELDKEGYGISEEMMKEAIAEQEQKTSDAAVTPKGEEK